MQSFSDKLNSNHASAKPILGNTFDAPKILGTKKPLDTVPGAFLFDGWAWFRAWLT